MAVLPGKCRLHNILREKKLTISELSQLTDIRIQQLSDYAYNRRKMSLTNALTVGFALETPVEELYELVITKRKRSRPKLE